MWGGDGAQATQAVSDALWIGEGRFVSRLASGRWFDVIVTPLRDAAGAPTRLVTTARDVTEQYVAQQRLADSELRFRTLADTMPQIVFTATADGRPDYFNQRWYEYTGAAAPPGPRAPAAADGKEPADSWGPFLHAADRDAALTAWSHAVQAGAPFQCQCRYKRGDGAYRWFMARALPLRDEGGHVARWFGTCTDVDDQKQVDEERSQLLISERTARTEAERAARLKDEFVSTLSHELRTPLNAMAGWIQVLQRDQRPDTLGKGLAVIDRNLKRQAQMIDQLLDMSRIVSGKMRLEIERVRFGAVIDEAVHSVQAVADVKGVRLDVASQRAAGRARRSGAPAADRLEPAAQRREVQPHRRHGGSGAAAGELLRRPGSAGRGAGDLARVHAPAVPAVPARRCVVHAPPRRPGPGPGDREEPGRDARRRGAGHERRPGEGRDVHHPLAAGAAGARRGERREQRPRPRAPTLSASRLLDGLVVLVVDDEPDARELLQHFLESAGARTALAASVDDAMQLLSQGARPTSSSATSACRIAMATSSCAGVRRLRGPAAEVPAAAVTALSRSDDRRRALMAGYQTHLAKPIDQDELVAVVATLAGRSGRVGKRPWVRSAPRS